jgi:hypothetical protein
MSERADSEAPRPCDLCGLPLPRKPWLLQTPERSYAFCCEGCLGIFRMLHELEEAPAPSRP